MIIISIIYRLLPHPPNFTPVGSGSLFAGAKLPRPWNYLTPILILSVSDLFLGWHKTMPYVYLSFIISVFLGELFLKKSYRTGQIITLSILSSLIFFLITNFGVWYSGWLYPKNFQGLLDSYFMALPFLRNMLIADVAFSLVIFKVYQYAQRSQKCKMAEDKLISWVLNSKEEYGR